MAHLLTDLANYFKLDEINIDNWTFKCFYKVSFIICMTGTTVSIASQYFGDPINCDFQGINQDLAQDYCWIHGSSYIPQRYQRHFGCIVDQINSKTGEPILSEDDAPDTSYYQWVTFVFAIQAAIFYIPYKIWSTLEGGLLSAFGTEAKGPILISEEAKYDDGVVMEAVVEKFVKYFKSIFHHNNWYFGYFVSCEFLNFFLLGFQFLLTDKFLNNQFRWYGYETILYYSHSLEERRNPEMDLRNPMCATFPTEVSCTIPNVGAAGKEQEHNGLCVLTQNVINEKLYLAMWFWYAILFPTSVIFFFYRLITIFFDRIRYGLIFKTIRHKYDKDINKSLEYILNKSQIGDWFVLYQLSKNTNPYFYREFIRELARDLKQRPKRSKSKSMHSMGNGRGSNTLKRNKLLEKDEESLIGMLTSPDEGVDLVQNSSSSPNPSIGRYVSRPLGIQESNEDQDPAE